MNIQTVIWKSMWSKRVRLILTFATVLITLIMYLLLTSLGDLFQGKLVENDFSERIIVDSATGLPFNSSHHEKLLNIPGVLSDEVAYNSPLVGYYQNPGDGFFKMGTDPEAFLRLERKYFSLTAEEEKAWKQDIRGAVVGRDVAKRMGWKVGDTIPIISTMQPRADGMPWEFVIKGILQHKKEGIFSELMVVHFKYLAEGKGGNYDIRWFALNVDNPEHAEKVAIKIDEVFKTTSVESSAKTLSALNASLNARFADFGLVIKLILAAVFFTMLLVTSNTMYQSFRERIMEFGVLRALGFSKKYISGVVIAESIFIFISANLLALALMYFCNDVITKYFDGIYMRQMVMLQSLGVSMLCSLVVSAAPIYEIRKLSIIDSLKR